MCIIYIHIYVYMCVLVLQLYTLKTYGANLTYVRTVLNLILALRFKTDVRVRLLLYLDNNARVSI